jgi:hypothetical protein
VHERRRSTAAARERARKRLQSSLTKFRMASRAVARMRALSDARQQLGESLAEPCVEPDTSPESTLQGRRASGSPPSAGAQRCTVSVPDAGAEVVVVPLASPLAVSAIQHRTDDASPTSRCGELAPPSATPQRAGSPRSSIMGDHRSDTHRSVASSSHRSDASLLSYVSSEMGPRHI